MESLGSAYIPREITRDFEIQQLLSESRYRETYLVTRLEDERLCVLRLDHTPLRNPRERRCLEESYIRLRRLRHPAFPEVIRFGVPRSGGHYLITEFARGVSLASLSREVDPPLIAEVFAKLLPPLHLLHLTGTVHQRLSPEKIIIEKPTSDRVVRIAGIGLSRNQDGRRAAKEGYSAPEVEYGARFDGGADLYSLAATAYAIFNGGRPYRPWGSSGYHEEGPGRDVPPVFKEEGKKVAALEALLLRMGSHERGYRPTNALVAANDLKRTGVYKSQPPAIEPACYVENTLWQVHEKKVRRLEKELEGLNREIRITADAELKPIADELTHITELRRVPRFVRVRPAGEGPSGPELDEHDAPEPFRAVLRAAEATDKSAEEGILVTHRTENELQAAVAPGASEADLARWFASFCMGPIDRRRSKLLAKWMHYKHNGEVNRVADYLSQLMLWDEGYPRLDWEKVGEHLVEYIQQLPTQWPKGYHRAFPRRYLMENANVIARYCFPREAGRLTEGIGNRATGRTGRARLEVQRARFLSATGATRSEAKALLVAARQARSIDDSLAELLSLRAAKLNRSYVPEAAWGRRRTRRGNLRPWIMLERIRLRQAIATATWERANGRRNASARTLAEAARQATAAELHLHNSDQKGSWRNGQLHALSIMKIETLLGEASTEIANAGACKGKEIVELACQTGCCRLHDRLRGRAMLVLATADRSIGQVRAARRWAARAGRIAAREGNTSAVAQAMMILASIHLESDELALARRYWKSASNEHKRIENPAARLNRAAIGSAITYTERDYRVAAQQAAIGLRLLGKEASSLMRSQLMHNLGLALQAMGRRSSGLTYMLKAAREASKSSVTNHSLSSVCAAIVSSMEAGSECDVREALSDRDTCTSMSEMEQGLIALWTFFRTCDPALKTLLPPLVGEKRRKIRGILLIARSSGVKSARASFTKLWSGDSSLMLVSDALLWDRLFLWKRLEEDYGAVETVYRILRELASRSEVGLAVRLANLAGARLLALGWLDLASEIQQLRDAALPDYRVQSAPAERRKAFSRLSLENLGIVVDAQLRDKSVRIEALWEWCQYYLELVEVSGCQEHVPIMRRAVRLDAEDLILRRRVLSSIAVANVKASCVDVIQAGSRAQTCIVRRVDFSPWEPSCSLTERAFSRHGNVRLILWSEIGRDVCVVGIGVSGREIDAQERVGVMSAMERIGSSWVCGNAPSSTRLVVAGFETEPSGDLLCASSRARKLGVNMIIESDAMAQTARRVMRLAHSGAAIVLTGETGTGKDLLARLAHLSSPWKDGPFVCIDCPSISPGVAESELFGHAKGAFTGADEQRVGLFGSAEGGMVFLDEVGDLSASMQAKILRVLSCGEFRPVGSARLSRARFGLVSATNLDLNASVRKGLFRADLYHRLGVQVRVPPLRDRLSDIAALWEFFLMERVGSGFSYENDVLDLLCSQEWPGNVRELRSLALAAVSLTDGAELKARDVEMLIGRETRGEPGAWVGDQESSRPMRIEFACRMLDRPGGTSRKELALAAGISARTALRDLTYLVRENIARRVGRGRAARYVSRAGT